jgi:hypothetical protein
MRITFVLALPIAVAQFFFMAMNIIDSTALSIAATASHLLLRSLSLLMSLVFHDRHFVLCHILFLFQFHYKLRSWFPWVTLNSRPVKFEHMRWFALKRPLVLPALPSSESAPATR